MGKKEKKPTVLPLNIKPKRTTKKVQLPKDQNLSIRELTKYDILFREGEKNISKTSNITEAGDDEVDSDEEDFFKNSSFLKSTLTDDAKFQRLSYSKQLENEYVDPKEKLKAEEAVAQLKKRKSIDQSDEEEYNELEEDEIYNENQSDDDDDDDEDDDNIENERENDNDKREWKLETVVKKRLPIKTHDGRMKTITQVITPKELKETREKQEKTKEQLIEQVTKERSAKNKQKAKKGTATAITNEVNKQIKEAPQKKQKKEKKDESSDESDTEIENLDILDRNINHEYDDDENNENTIKSNMELSKLSEGERYLREQELIDNAKISLAKASSLIISNPENNIQAIKELFSICINNKNIVIKKYSILSLCAVFKDIIPGYKINKDVAEEIKNGQTSAEGSGQQKQKLSKEVKKIREYEKKLLKFYQNYLVLVENSISNILSLLARKRPNGGGIGFFKINGGYSNNDLTSLLQCILKAVSTLLITHPHFNFRTNLVTITSRFTVYKDKDIAMMCLESIKSLFEHDSTGGETSLEVVRCLANVAKSANYMIDPKVVRVFLAMRLTDVVEKINPFGIASDDTTKLSKKDRKHLTRTEKKKRKEDKELDKEMKEAEAEFSAKEQRFLQTEILKSIFILYFRIIKKAPQSPALTSVLEGLAKFSHLISVDFLGDLLKVLSDLIENGITSIANAFNTNITAFKTIKLHGGSLNVDLKDYYVRVYSLLTDMVLPREHGVTVTALDALQLMLGDKKQTAVERVASFIKRLSTISLFLQPHASLALVSFVKQLFITYPQTQRLLETDSTFSGGDYVAEAQDPDHCNPFASTLWELSLLVNHWHPKFEPMVKRIISYNESQMSSQHVTRERSPLELYRSYDNSKGGFNPPIEPPKEHHLVGKIRKLKKAFKNREIVVFITPQKQFEKSSFLSQCQQQTTEKEIQNKNITFNNYFNESQDFNKQMKLFKNLEGLKNLKSKLTSIQPQPKPQPKPQPQKKNTKKSTK
ncbi:hypothetical protein RB653_003447 [Dictyostelium firmibasis]|uniref:Nucleolar complex protein 3 homolog n=1 Tax=Dictyostelium firmibasis TaxID=79012 RepID=A0AAN7TZ87_9MYCE